MSADDPTAIRHPKRGKAHRPLGLIVRGVERAWCWKRSRRMTERVPLSTVPTTARCQKCWPDTKEVTP